MDDLQLKHFYYSAAIVLCCLFLCLAFGKCNTGESEALTRFRLCLDKAHDISKCDEPVEKKFTVETPSK